MTSFSKDVAMKIHWDASPAIRQVLLTEARTNIQARQSAMIALEQRVSQAGAALFAAAAFAATFAVTFREASFAFSALGGLATIAFTVGAMVSLWGVKAGDIIFPGSSISWWSDCDFLADETNEQADYWVAGQLEQAIESYDKVARLRADHLNLGIKYGIAGGLLIAFSGFLAIFA